MKRVRDEKNATDRTIEDLVNTRLLMSYEAHPGPLRIGGQTSAAAS